MMKKPQRIITEQEVREKLPERFWSKIRFGDIKECWEWIAGKTTAGYGSYSIVINGKWDKTYAHRFILEKLQTNIKNLCSLHSCDNPGCVNPNHLFPGTKQDNMDDMYSKGRDRHNPNRGSQHHRSKLNESQVIEIKKRVANGEKQISIARFFNVTKAQIYNIRMGKSWGHINIA